MDRLRRPEVRPSIIGRPDWCREGVSFRGGGGGVGWGVRGFRSEGEIGF